MLPVFLFCRGQEIAAHNEYISALADAAGEVSAELERILKMRQSSALFFNVKPVFYNMGRKLNLVFLFPIHTFLKLFCKDCINKP